MSNRNDIYGRDSFIAADIEESQSAEAKRIEAQEAADAREQARVLREFEANRAAETKATENADSRVAQTKLEEKAREAFMKTNSGASENDFQLVKQALIKAIQIDAAVQEARRRKPLHSIYNF